ncbi:MAG: GDP-L-fucose synthase family protein [Thermodesulfobium sp.]
MQFLENKKIVITGASGFFGRNLISVIKNEGLDKKNDILAVGSKDYDLKNKDQAIEALKNAEIVINLASNVGGIGYNMDFPGTLFYDNIVMGVNVIESSRINKVKKLIQIGTVCSYPKIPPHIPFRESDLWEGFPEETNAPYGIAKKALITMGDAYRAQYGLNIINLLVVNLYGPGDNFDPRNSHVIPALIRKFFDAKNKREGKVKLWGSGNSSREFLFVSDAAKGVLAATNKYNGVSPVNLGSGMEITIKELAETISSIIGYEGKIEWDTSMPDGQPRRYLDTTLAWREFGFKASTDFNIGLRKTIEWYKENVRGN